jgi:exonuclease SbcD
MENYGKIDPETGIHSRLLDFSKAFAHCIDAAIAHNVDFFLFSGDAYKTINPSPTQQRLLLQALLRLQQAGIPVIIIVGNHDNPLSFGKANTLDIFGDLPLTGFHVISKPTTLQLQTKNGPVNIVGIPWPTRNSISLAQRHTAKSATEITAYISQSVAHIIKEYARALDPSIPAVLGGHLTVSSGIFSGSEKRAIYGNDPVFLPSQLAIEPFDYVGLGHLHRHQNLNPHGYPAIVYSGSIERVDFGEHKEEKGFCLVTIKEKGAASYEFIEVPTRPFIQLELKLKPDENQTDQILNALGKKNITDAVIKIIYHVPESKQDLVDLKRVEQACASAIHLVGIIPVRSSQSRERRIGAIKSTADLPTLLNSYFASKPDLKDKADNLVSKALLLLEEEEVCE